MAHFLQTPPELPDAWFGDRALREALLWHLGEDVFARADHELAGMGREATSSDRLALAARAEQEPPRLIRYTPWGKRIDRIEVSDAYRELGRWGVEAGVTSIPYEDSPYGVAARLVWGALVIMWGPSSALYSCPVAMTDAAARTLLMHGDVEDVAVVDRLTSRVFDEAWTSGQWMTETAGGSDVGRTGTIARHDGEVWRLHGTKWFTSATTSEIALTLARPEGAPAGTRGLALWRIHRILEDGSPNLIRVRRLKDKLGTRALPTAELELDGAIARPVGDPSDGGGVRRIATMLNLTRIHNSLGAVGALTRGLEWARAYARVREVFGRPLESMPAHRATLADLAVDRAAALELTLRCCELMGRVEAGEGEGQAALILRALTPVTKLATARWAVAGTAEAMEAVGGVAYCEDSTIPALVRNTHVMPIWEGTTNVLSLDVLRSARAGAVAALIEDGRIAARAAVADTAVAEAAQAALGAFDDLETRLTTLEGDDLEASARSIALGLASAYACARLSLQGAWAVRSGDGRTAAVARRLASRGLVPPPTPTDDGLGMDEPLPEQTPIR